MAFATGTDLLTRLAGQSYSRLAETAYADSGVAYRCIALIARSAASVPWLLYDTSGPDRKEVVSHPGLSLVSRPSPLLRTREALVEALASHLVIGGNAYLLGVGPDAGAPPRELYPIQPDRVSVSQRGGLLPIYQMSDTRLGSRSFTPDPITGQCELLHLRRFAPLDPLIGQGDAHPGRLAIHQHSQSALWNISLLSNGGRPSLALVYEPKDGDSILSDEQFARLKTELKDQHSGTANAGSIMVLDGGLTPKELSISPKDMDWLAGRKQAAIEIATSFGVPAQLIGIPDAQTYANMEQARLAFWEDTVLPLLRAVIADVNQWLWPTYDEEHLAFDIDEDAIPALATRRFDVFKKLQDADFLTDDEKRAAVGYGPIEGGDKLRPRAAVPRTPPADPAKASSDAAAVVKQALIRDGWSEADAEALARKG
jgi:HK97 family phage portal protein